MSAIALAAGVGLIVAFALGVRAYISLLDRRERKQGPARGRG